MGGDYTVTQGTGYPLSTIQVLCIGIDGLEARGSEVRFLRGTLSSLEVLPVVPDVVLLGLTAIAAEGLDGWRQARTRTGAPIIVVATRMEQDLCRQVLDEGADDFVTTPLDPTELLMRIHMHAARVHRTKMQHAMLRVGALAIDLERKLVSLRGAPVQVTPAEFRLLAALARRPGETTRRDELLEAVHGSLDAAFDRSIDVLVSRLRAKLEVDQRVPSLIRTIRGTGYALTVSD